MYPMNYDSYICQLLLALPTLCCAWIFVACVVSLSASSLAYVHCMVHCSLLMVFIHATLSLHMCVVRAEMCVINICMLTTCTYICMWTVCHPMSPQLQRCFSERLKTYLFSQSFYSELFSVS